MEEKKIDRRILKTKKAIRNAYTELLKTKNSNDISIKDIADVADISRKTFYYYYDGVWQIEDEIENELTNLLKKELENLDIEVLLKNPQNLFQNITKIISTDLDFYGNLILNDRQLLSKFSVILEEEFKKRLNAHKIDDETINIVSKYCIHGVISIYQYWFNSDRKISLEQISRDLGKIMFEGLNIFVKDDSKKSE